jgi:hypothetical protein
MQEVVEQAVAVAVHLVAALAAAVLAHTTQRPRQERQTQAAVVVVSTADLPLRRQAAAALSLFVTQSRKVHHGF